MNKSLILLSTMLLFGPATAAISLDRTRVIYPGSTNSISISIRNNNKMLPYLAHAWLEDESGNRINSPFTVLPPLQRLEPDMDSLVKIQALPAVSMLPQDRESLFYFNLREIPPRSNKPNTLQLAMQTRIKLFYRPKDLLSDRNGNNSLWQEKLILESVNGKYHLTNPTPYYVTIVDAANSSTDEVLKNFNPLMIAPNSSVIINFNISMLGDQPAFTYIDDYGGRRTLSYNCTAQCRLEN
ncbi:fimbria/pilus periplasmic chaperone [Vibrio cholerae]